MSMTVHQQAVYLKHKKQLKNLNNILLSFESKMRELEEKCKAVFVISPKNIDELFTSRDITKIQYCATTRRENKKTTSFPGGKRNPGESLIGTARRECFEEGWVLRESFDGLDDFLKPALVYFAEVEDSHVAWFFAPGGMDLLSDYKEKESGIVAKHASISDAFCNMDALGELKKSIKSIA